MTTLFNNNEVNNNSIFQDAESVIRDKEQAMDESDAISASERSLMEKMLRRGLVRNTNIVDVQRSNPNSPFYSVKSFEEMNLPEELLKGVYKMGFNAPSSIQETAIPTLLADPPQNMIAQSQSGTGKTAAFVMAMLYRADPSKKYPQILCLAPTYELAIQIGDVIGKMSEHMSDILVRYAVRGLIRNKEEKITEPIIVGTPGKILDWSLKLKLFDLKKISVFVLDEADIMISLQGHQDQSIRIQKNLSDTCQMVLFSATYEQAVMDFANAVVQSPVTIRLRREDQSLDNVKQFYVYCPTQVEKYKAITNIYGAITVGQAIVFVHTRAAVKWLAEKMRADGHAVGVLSGDLSVDERLEVLDKFRKGDEKVLIATNVLSRGIDIQQVNLVVSYDLPVTMAGNADFETYIHRIGRTGRFGQFGVAINLVDSPKGMRIVEDIGEHFSKPIAKLNAESIEGMEILDDDIHNL